MVEPGLTSDGDGKYWQLAGMAHDWRWVKVTTDEMAVCKRRAEIVAGRRAHSRNNFAKGDQAYGNYLGELGELAVRKWSGLRQQSLDYKKGAPDVGNYEVKTCGFDVNCWLSVNQSTLKDRIYILVLTHLLQDRWLAIMGWAQGWELRAAGLWTPPWRAREKVFRLSWLRLHSMTELEATL